MEPPITTTTPTLLTWSDLTSPAAITLAIAALLVFFALAVLSLQFNAIQHHLKALRIHVRESRDWLRRNAADQRSADFHTLVFKPHLLSRHLDYIHRQTAVTLQDIRQAKSENPEIIDALHSLLDYYEGLARGIEHGVLSERVVKAAHHENMARALRIFRPYIEEHRMQSIIGVWTRVETLVIKWDDADAQHTQLAPSKASLNRAA